MQEEKPEEIIIVAAATNNVIGNQGKIPWHCPEELRLFRALTLGATLIMGRRTYLAIGRPLDGRVNIVVSATLAPAAEIIVAPSLDAAIAIALALGKRIYYCGGAQIYAAALERAGSIELSRMQEAASGDVLFPEIDPCRWQVVREEDYGAFVHYLYQRREQEEVKP